MDFHVGQELTVERDVRCDSTGDYGYGYTVSPGDIGVVTRVTRNMVLVRFPGFEWNGGRSSLPNQDRSGWFNKQDMIPADPNAPRPPRPRQFGETPEGMIAIDDPRIDWIWEDAAAIATKKGYCGVYDELADMIGAPGRERDFKIKRKVNGIEGVFTIRARSRRLAEKALDESFA